LATTQTIEKSAKLRANHFDTKIIIRAVSRAIHGAFV
jgi:hypothetical protein